LDISDFAIPGESAISATARQIAHYTCSVWNETVVEDRQKRSSFRVRPSIMHQRAVFANEVDVFVVDFEVENGLRAGAREFLLDDFEVAAEGLQAISGLQRVGLNVLLPVHGPERMIRRRADGFRGSGQ
jgi:hypothetical protein